MEKQKLFAAGLLGVSGTVLAFTIAEGIREGVSYRRSSRIEKELSGYKFNPAKLKEKLKSGSITHHELELLYSKHLQIENILLNGIHSPKTRIIKAKNIAIRKRSWPKRGWIIELEEEDSGMHRYLCVDKDGYSELM